VILLDTNACSGLIRGDSRRLEARVRRLPPREVCISAVTRAELLYGLARRPGATRLHESVSALFARVRSLAWSNDAASHYAEIRASLESAGKPIGPLDQMIAAHARSLGAALVTGNVREFSRVAGLEVLDWVGDA
jgi:tRNA(fMet)-specific endonuclease VapC